MDRQDGPYLESSSYLDMTLRYVGPLDPESWDFGTLGPSDPGNLGTLRL